MSEPPTTESAEVLDNEPAAEQKLRAAISKTGQHLSAYWHKKTGLCFNAVKTAKPEWYNEMVEQHLQNFRKELSAQMNELFVKRNLRKRLLDLEEINSKVSIKVTFLFLRFKFVMIVV